MKRTITTLAFMLMFAKSSVGATQLEPPTGKDAKTASEVTIGTRQGTLAVNGVLYYIDTEIATGELGDERFAHGIFLFHLKCASDLACQLDLISLNECENTKNAHTSFTPRLGSWDTSSGLLEARQLSNSQFELVVYQASGNKLPAKIILTFATKGRPFQKLTGFKGTGFVNHHLWPNVNEPVDYVPVQRDRTKLLDCPVLLHGLN